MIALVVLGGVVFIVLPILIGKKILGAIFRLVTGGNLRKPADRAAQLRGMADFIEMSAVVTAALAIVVLANPGETEINPFIVAFCVVVASFGLTYYRKSPTMLVISLVELAIWFTAQATHWADGSAQPAPVMSAVIVLALTCLLAARLHRTGFEPESFWNIYALVGIVALALFSVILSSSSGTKILNDGIQEASNATVAARIFYITLAALSLLFATYLFSNGKLSPVEFSIYLAIFASYSFIALTCIPFRDVTDLYGIDNSVTEFGALWFIVSNVLVGLQIYWLLAYGYKNRDRMLINLGTTYLIVVIFVKYFDFFSNLQKSLFFLGLAAILIGTGVIINDRVKSDRALVQDDKKSDV